jgi:Fe-S cluster assembly ATPase SufC
VGQTGPGWVSLFDGKPIGSEWDRVGESNWRVEDGAIVADKRTGEINAHLVTKAKYKDFQVYVEFWASDNATSGIFLRCQDPTRITGRS